MSGSRCCFNVRNSALKKWKMDSNPRYIKADKKDIANHRLILLLKLDHKIYTANS